MKKIVNLHRKSILYIIFLVALVISSYVIYHGYLFFLQQNRWYSYQQKPTNCAIEPVSHFGNTRTSPPSCFVWLADKDEQGWQYSKGPWWIDPNHEMLVGGKGYGMVNVIAFTQVQRKFFLGAFDLTEREIEFEIDNSKMNMVQAYGRNGLQQSHIYFWLQTEARAIEDCDEDPQVGENCTRQTNYILTAKDSSTVKFDLAENNGFHKLNLSSFAPDDWVCLEAGRNRKYDDCLPIEEGLKQAYAVGFLAAPVNECITDKPWQAGGVCDLKLNKQYQTKVFNTGEFALRNFNIIGWRSYFF